MKHFVLELTCEAYPEQYYVYLDNKKVGYLRLRDGIFRCDYPDWGKKTIYIAYPEGRGLFKDEERHRYLQDALSALAKKLKIKNFDYEITSYYFIDD